MSALRAFDKRTELEIVGDEAVLDMVEHGIDPEDAMSFIYGTGRNVPRGLLTKPGKPLRVRGQVDVDQRRFATAWRMLMARR